MLRCRVRAEDADLAQGVLALLGAEGFELRDAEVDAAVPDGEVWILVYGDDAPIAQLAQDASSFERWLAPPELESIASVDWAEAWRVYFSPLRLSPRLAVVPSWEEWTPPKGVFVIPVDPGSAFGTGQHETTALCAQAIDQIAAEVGLGDFADVGCGTGILGIGAQLLSAQRIWMVDNDPLAVAVAQENIEMMGLESVVELTCAPRPVHEHQFHTVVANILAPVLIRLCEDLSALVAEQGRLLLSGLLVTQIAEVEAPFLAKGWRRKRLHCEGEWALLWLER